MPCGVRLYGWREDIELLHGAVEAACVVVGYLHGLKLLEAGLLGYLVVALVSVVLEVPDIGYVPDIAHLVAKMAEITEEDVECYGGAGVAEMGVAVDCGAADIHADIGGMERLEAFFLAVEGVVY